MKPMNEEHLAVLRRHMVEVVAIHADLASEELGKAAFDERVVVRRPAKLEVRLGS
jgi:protein-L-isoaspartate(D-aspartate) O-methyltransferase